MNKAPIQNMTSVIWGRYSKAAKIRSSLYQNTSAQLKSYLLNFTLCKPTNIPVHNSIYIYIHTLKNVWCWWKSISRSVVKLWMKLRLGKDCVRVRSRLVWTRFTGHHLLSQNENRMTPWPEWGGSGSRGGGMTTPKTVLNMFEPLQ